MAMGFAVAQQMIQQPGGIAGTQQPSAASPQGAGAGSPELLTPADAAKFLSRSEEHTSELQSQSNLVCRLLLEKKKKKIYANIIISINRIFTITLLNSHTNTSSPDTPAYNNTNARSVPDTTGILNMRCEASVD